MRINGGRVIGIATMLAILLSTMPASAQYFGRNKVRYKQFAFQVLKTERFDIYFYPEEKSGVDISARLAERWYERLSKVLMHELDGRQPLVLYASHPDFEQTNIIHGELGEATGGVTEPIRRRIVLPLGRPLADVDHVIGHELVHAFQFDMTINPSAPAGQAGLSALPLWFIEGMAEYLSLGPVDANTAMWLRDAVQRGVLPSVKELDKPEYFPYRWGHAFWAYVAGRWGDHVIRSMLITASVNGDVEAAIARVLDIEPEDFSTEWQEEIRRAYRPMLASSTPMEGRAKRIVSGDGLGGDLNVGPAISPSGRWVAFLSSRSFFSVDLYVAEAASGRIKHRLTRTATNPHFSSLQFIHSAGAWDGRDRRLAIATISSGRAALAIFDVEGGGKVREVPIPTLDEIFNPAWSPDGRAIAFSGTSQGLLDLYIYDLKTSTLRRLTSDAYAELQPAWSPDGRRIAFATDRFSTDLQSLAIGSYRLATFDLERGAIDPLPGFSDGDSLNPQWAPGGGSLYFLASPFGIPNLFRVDLSTGSLHQITNVATGVSGITGSSPAMSVSAESGNVSFSVYEEGRYHIYAAHAADLPSFLPSSGLQNAAVLPPFNRRPTTVSTLLSSPAVGLPADEAFPTEHYKPTLALESVGQAGVGVGATQLGTTFVSDLSMQFRDLLGDRLLAFAVQSGSLSITNTAAQVGYLNGARRWNWAVFAGHVPYLSGWVESTAGTSAQGDAVVTDQAVVYRETQKNVTGLVAYPFSRARRFELSGALTQMSFDQIVMTATYAQDTGHLLFEETDQTTLAAPLTMGTAAMAFVGDTAQFGATSPIQGWRYRLEAAPTAGTLNFTSALADFRRYFMPISFYTVAVRALHHARYGADSEDPRLYPLHLGYPGLVRGYDSLTFDEVDCGPSGARRCPAFDQLRGSRLFVGNVELRFPLLRPFGASQRMYGPVPAEVAVFADGGVAWNRGEDPSLLGGSRKPVSSVGLTLRVNVMGSFVCQFDAARAHQREDKSWVFQFNLTPGF
jgi:Tol biopolymer transport system component